MAHNRSAVVVSGCLREGPRRTASNEGSEGNRRHQRWRPASAAPPNLRQLSTAMKCLLKGCPCCSSPAKANTDPLWASIVCSKCGIKIERGVVTPGRSLHAARRQCAEAWNLRPSSGDYIASGEWRIDAANLPPDAGRVKGGKARWKGTTKKARSEAASKAARVRWAMCGRSVKPKAASHG